MSTEPEGDWQVRVGPETFRADVPEPAWRVLLALEYRARNRAWTWATNEDMAGLTGRPVRVVQRVLDRLETREDPWVVRVYAAGDPRWRLGILLVRRLHPALPAVDSDAVYRDALRELCHRAVLPVDHAVIPCGWRPNFPPSVNHRDGGEMTRSSLHGPGETSKPSLHLTPETSKMTLHRTFEVSEVSLQGSGEVSEVALREVSFLTPEELEFKKEFEENSRAPRALACKGGNGNTDPVEAPAYWSALPAPGTWDVWPGGHDPTPAQVEELHALARTTFPGTRIPLEFYERHKLYSPRAWRDALREAARLKPGLDSIAYIEAIARRNPEGIALRPAATRPAAATGPPPPPPAVTTARVLQRYGRHLTGATGPPPPMDPEAARLLDELLRATPGGPRHG